MKNEYHKGVEHNNRESPMFEMMNILGSIKFEFYKLI